MRGAYEIDDFMELCFLVFGRLFLTQILQYGELLAKRSGDQWDKWGTREGQEREQEEDQREVAFFEKVHMYSSVGEDRPSDAGGPRFDSQCPLLRQIHVIYEVFVTCS